MLFRFADRPEIVHQHDFNGPRNAILNPFHDELPQIELVNDFRNMRIN